MSGGGNPNHDPKTGEFSSGGGGSGGGHLSGLAKQAGLKVAEPFSFTNPNVPLFGPKYQEIKSNAAAAMANLRTAMSRIK